MTGFLILQELITINVVLPLMKKMTIAIPFLIKMECLKLKKKVQLHFK